MRLHSILPVVAAALFCLVPQLPAQQFDSPQTFSLFGQSGINGSHLGVSLKDIDADRARVINLGDPRGVEVVGVQEGSPAEQAGIKTGDVLLSYNGENILGAQQLGRLVSETPRGRKIKIEYWREGKVSTVTATTAGPAAMQFPNQGELQLMKMQGFGPFESSFPMPFMVWKTPFGIECESLDSQLAEYFGVKHGVLIRSVVKDSPAAKAGLRAGDIVTQIGDHGVYEPKDITSYLRTERRSFNPLSLEVTREHKAIAVKISPAPDAQQ
jgi:serine protease Do